MIFVFKNRQLAFSGVSRLMGIVNVTPDSFSDGGKYFNPKVAVAHGLNLLEDGADIIDIGGESTRPGAEAVSSAEEISRIVPVIRELKICLSHSRSAATCRSPLPWAANDGVCRTPKPFHGCATAREVYSTRSISNIPRAGSIPRF